LTLHLNDALETLYGLERRKDKLGLEGTRALLSALGDPQRRFRAVHVAGTNGKGSVCALIERVLREAGHRTGLFTSPHLVDFRERIRVNGQWADETRLTQRLEHIQGLPESEGRTFFEVCTALAFDDFAARGVEWAVVEVGLGGRLDTTNVLVPELCVITSIGLDHVDVLGSTLEAIAAEKAGILKAGVPVVVNLHNDARVLEVIQRIAAERGAPIVGAADRGPARDLASGVTGLRLTGTPWGGALTVPVGMQGSRAFENAGVAGAALAALARAGVAIPEGALRSGFRAARWPGRLEACPGEPRLWWDGAHNPQGIDALEGAGPFDAVVLALSADKDVRDMVSRLWKLVRPAPLIATRSRNPRAMAPQAIAEAATSIGWECGIDPDVPSAVRAALDRTRAGGGRVLLTGSLFAIGEAMTAFGGAPGEWL
jgi:dihydrofolate synthase/folylpolyglutamate synthase